MNLHQFLKIVLEV